MFINRWDLEAQILDPNTKNPQKIVLLTELYAALYDSPTSQASVIKQIQDIAREMIDAQS